MTIEEFMMNYGIKNRKKVIKWINEGLIPGGNLEENYVPDSARCPYTSARAKTTDAIYYSIVEASRQRRHVLPSLYRICNDEFQGYIRELVNAGLIIMRISDGVTYYDATLQARNMNKRAVLNAVRIVIEGVTSGIARAFI